MASVAPIMKKVFFVWFPSDSPQKFISNRRHFLYFLAFWFTIHDLNRWKWYYVFSWFGV